ncbi:MAG: hypothetical protein ACK4JF_04635 [Methylohalobius sp.]
MDLLILNALWQNRRLTPDEAMRLTQKPETEVRAGLNRLVEFGLVEARSEHKGHTWHFSAAIYRRLGKPLSMYGSRALNRSSRSRW